MVSKVKVSLDGVGGGAASLSKARLLLAVARAHLVRSLASSSSSGGQKRFLAARTSRRHVRERRVADVAPYLTLLGRHAHLDVNRRPADEHGSAVSVRSSPTRGECSTTTSPIATVTQLTFV